MTSRERVKAAMHFEKPDKVPVQYYYCPVGYYEHGDKLNDLYAALPGDFEPFRPMPCTGPAPDEYDENGRYHYFFEDEWGVTWEKRIFGVTGIPCKYPLEDTSKLSSYKPPVPVTPDHPDFPQLKARIDSMKEAGYYTFHGTVGIYEKLITLCGDENALCGIALEDEDVEAIADMIMEYGRKCTETAVALGADGLAIGDDYGGEKSLLISPAMWRRFIKPRLAYILEPAVKAGMDIHFHSCGMVWDILPDFKELGVTSIWPQLPAYDMEKLAAKCRELGLAVALHTDRANTMTFGTPQQVRDLVRKEAEIFDVKNGGAWFYVEADNDFPFENLKALVETIKELQ